MSPFDSAQDDMAQNDMSLDSSFGSAQDDDMAQDYIPLNSSFGSAQDDMAQDYVPLNSSSTLNFVMLCGVEAL